MPRTAFALAALLALSACADGPESDLLAPDDVSFAAATWSAHGSGQAGVPDGFRFGFNARDTGGLATKEYLGHYRYDRRDGEPGSHSGLISCMNVIKVPVKPTGSAMTARFVAVVERSELDQVGKLVVFRAGDYADMSTISNFLVGVSSDLAKSWCAGDPMDKEFIAKLGEYKVVHGNVSIR